MLKNYDWLKLTSEEWLKGKLIAVYDREFEFDSDELGLQVFDAEDVAELITHKEHSLRLLDRRIVRGKLEIDKDYVNIIRGDEVEKIKRYMVVSIAATSGLKEINYWSGNVAFGLTIREGNTNQKDFLLDIDSQRRTAQSRLINSYIGNISEQSGIETTNNQRLNTGFDWFLSNRLFWRVATIEYFSDKFQNTDSRITMSTEIGYLLFDESSFSWEISGGPGYQVTKFESVELGEEEEDKTFIASGSTELYWDINSDIEYNFSYDVQIVSDASGGLIHHLKTGIEIELINDFDIALTYYWDRIEDPVENDSGITPNKDDKRFVVSIAYEF